ncbi:transcriptional regulator [Knoellia sinensis KCTC 19936]|uniref:Transcriptional regulator n=1 Tax=Knoellia sinensis KCTC 19936 TaxID=1385520 RepID=A0A0A0J3D1_9MICO|nr:AraC family transcriptional regulator [Knoellia sinensis]KGN30141.1 transcriptional regulator [Knoellia sinensis KCTC 19936]
MGPMIRAASLRGFAPLVRELGGEPDELCRRFGIEPAALESDDALVPITEHDLMLDAAALELGCPDLGLRLASWQDITILGPLAVAIEASSTVWEALACASRFMFIHSPALSVGLEPDPRGVPGVLALTYRKDLRESTYSPQGIELGLGLMHRIAVSILGERYGLRSVDVSHAPLSPVGRYVEHFGVEDVRFGTDVAAMRAMSAVLDETFEGANAAIHTRAVAHLTSRHVDPRTTVGTQVRLAVADLLGSAPASLSTIARLLQTHPRTLQRHLAKEGTTFDAVVDSVRREAAHRYLTTTDLPMTQISSLLGFGEQSTLTRAVRRWEGRSPRAVRRDARA